MGKCGLLVPQGRDGKVNHHANQFAVCRFVPNKRTKGPLEGHRGFAVFPFLYIELGT